MKFAFLTATRSFHVTTLVDIGEYLKIAVFFMVVIEYYWFSMHADVYGPIRKRVYFGFYTRFSVRSLKGKEKRTAFFRV